MKKTIFLILLLFGNLVYACKNPAPPATPFIVPTGVSCPSGYSQSGNMCNPTSSSARFAFVIPSGQSCPSGYSQSGPVCTASSLNACNAFYAGNNTCPSGYSQSGHICLAN